MFETIVLATDGSEPSRRALGIATDLAHHYTSEVVVVHVRELDDVGGLEFESVDEEAPWWTGS
jgi:nucleotide-binding universal stress UspA family protein